MSDTNEVRDLPDGFSVLDRKKHGIGGIIATAGLTEREQDEKAKPFCGFAVVFFPRIVGIKGSYLVGSVETVSQTPEAAIAKFMDRIKVGELWETYNNAGWLVRRIKISDEGPA